MAEPIYLDHNASTPCDLRVVEAMLPYFSENYANPTSRSHSAGRDGYTALESCRRKVAGFLGASSATEITFTSGATESNNAAIFGFARALVHKGRHVITQATEHPAVLEPMQALASEGWEQTVLPVNGEGLVDPADLKSAIRTDTVLVSLMLANNETGTVQRIDDLAAVTRQAGVVLHCDAAQGVGKIDVDVKALDLDAMSISAHKFYGPKGIGALYVRRQGPQPKPLLFGGGQEYGRRSGTNNLAGIVGLATACEICDIPGDISRLAEMRDLFERRLLALGGVTINGCRSQRLPGTSNLSFAGIDGEALLASLPDFALSSGSACASVRPEPSRVLRAMGVPAELARASIRIGVGRMTRTDEIERAAIRVAEEVVRLRGSAGKRRR